MKIRLLWVLLLLPALLVGCGKESASPTNTEIVYYDDNSGSARYSQFFKLPVVNSEPDPDGVSFEGIGFASDGAYIMVSFKAPLNQSQLWQQDYIYVVDEANMGVYKDVPVAPIIGPLIGRPAKEGQVGYVMLYNYYNGVKEGSVVTVVIGNYKREHVKIITQPSTEP